WLDPSGSSTGSAVAISANLAPLAIGTETIGSIISPSARSGGVGFKPSLGLISGDMVIPIANEIDSAGPIGRTVTDVALAMTVLAGSGDLGDPRTSAAAALIGADFSASLDSDHLQGASVGIIAFDSELSDEDQLDMYDLWEEVEALEGAGATVTVIRPPEFPSLDVGTFLSCDMRHGVDDWLTRVDAEFESLDEITTFNESSPWLMPYGQERLIEAANCPLTDVETSTLGESMRRAAREYMDALFAENHVDLLLSVDDLFSLQYALSGFPAISIPHGATAEGIPSGLTLVGPYLSDIDLLGYAFAFEQTATWRVPPALVAAILPPE
ncbi:MAG: amidase family protein, partial [Thermomicrobiales bacterium]